MRQISLVQVDNLTFLDKKLSILPNLAFQSYFAIPSTFGHFYLFLGKFSHYLIPKSRLVCHIRRISKFLYFDQTHI